MANVIARVPKTSFAGREKIRMEMSKRPVVGRGIEASTAGLSKPFLAGCCFFATKEHTTQNLTIPGTWAIQAGFAAVAAGWHQTCIFLEASAFAVLLAAPFLAVATKARTLVRAMPYMLPRRGRRMR